ncbi:MAG: PAS domain-containing sensor histidine kinase [Planctomycetota bacterium]|jgi:signal transduction histidine kinase
MLDNVNAWSIISPMQDYHQKDAQNSEGAIRNQHIDHLHNPPFQPFIASILHALPLGVVTFAPDLKIIDANTRAATLIRLEGYIDKSLATGTEHAPPNDINWTRQLTSTVSGGKTFTFDRLTYTLNGRTRLLRIICTPLQDDRTQNIRGGALIVEDVTEKITAQRQLADLEKLAALGRLACKVAHELNNPMDGILRYINLALRTIEQENLHKPKEYLTHSRQGLMRMVHIVSDLLEFSRSTGASFECEKIERLIDDAIKTMDPRTEHANLKIARDYAPGMPQIRSGNLFQVFCNIIKNALDAMPDGGTLTVSTRLTTDNTAVVRFQDTGVGFPPEHADFLFQPFFTTKERGKGTGLGLAICKDIIERHHGRITAENTPGGGAIFTLYLPVTDINP